MTNIEVKYPSNKGKLGYVVSLEEIVEALTDPENEALLQAVATAIEALD